MEADRTAASTSRRREWRIWGQGVLFGVGLTLFVLALAGAFR